MPEPNWVERAFAAATEPKCKLCCDSGIEEVYGGHGTVLEVPCSCQTWIEWPADPQPYAEPLAALARDPDARRRWLEGKWT